MKRFLCLTLSLLLLSSLALTAFAEGEAAPALSETEQSALQRLEARFAVDDEALLIEGEESLPNMYTEISWRSVADSFPAHFDLRDRGVVTPVKSQSPWGTCWSFGTIAASESSILSDLHLTAEEFAAQYGYEMDLSEKHLAWFASNPLPETAENGQAGEGAHGLDPEDYSAYNSGGTYLLATSSLASGVGIVTEALVPYESSTGSLDWADDWSLDEAQRFLFSYELKDANVLPNPAGRDADGNYVYHPEGTEAIKSELLKGRAVGIAFHADQSMPARSPEEIREGLNQSLADNKNATEEDKQTYIDIRCGAIDTDSMTDEELRGWIAFRFKINNMDENTYDLSGLSHDELATVLKSNYFTLPLEEVLEREAEVPYIVYFGDPMISAQYTYESAPANHAVCIVGWDDDFSAENFPEGHRPPADGAWIVKNSWGTDWGTDGYFYLSFYDMNLCMAETFSWLIKEAGEAPDEPNILQYDYMPCENISSTLFDLPVYSANIFEVSEDSVLQYVSTMTGDLNALATVSVYLLDKDATRPTDGIMLESVTQECAYAGYHRITLPQNVVLDHGARISVVTLIRVPTDEGLKYSLTNAYSLSEAGVEDFNRLEEDDDMDYAKYSVGVVNPGESFVSFDPERWLDWYDVLESINENEYCARHAYDNLPIKAYAYPLDQVLDQHSFDLWARTTGDGAAICIDCGYMLLFASPGRVS